MIERMGDIANQLLISMVHFLECESTDSGSQWINKHRKFTRNKINLMCLTPICEFISRWTRVFNTGSYLMYKNNDFIVIIIIFSVFSLLFFGSVFSQFDNVNGQINVKRWNNN